MTPFEPVGEHARWRTIYDLMRSLRPGDVLSYQQMGEALDLDPYKDRLKIQAAVRRAAREYEQVDHRVIEGVPGSGYRVVQPIEHARLAQLQRRRANRSLQRGHSIVTNVDFNGLDPATRQGFELMAQGFAAQMDFNRRIEQQQRRQAETLDSVQQRVERSESELDALRSRLERLEGPRLG